MNTLAIECPHCSRQIHAPANVQAACPQCGGQVIAEETPRAVSASGLRWWQLLLLVPFVFGGVMYAVMQFRAASEYVPPRRSYHTLDGPPGGYDAIKASAWDGSVSEAETYIKGVVRDPNLVTFHQWKNFTNDTRHITTVDFTAVNSFGGPTRATWVFSFDKGSGKLMHVSDGQKTLMSVEP